MSGYLEFFNLQITCSNCSNTFEALFCEDGDTRDPPQVITFLASGKTTCPHCSKIITEDKIQFPQSSEKH